MTLLKVLCRPVLCKTEGIDPTAVDVPSGGTASVDDGFQILPFGMVNGVIVEDRNGNGVQDNGEPGVEVLAVVIFDSSGRAQTFTSDSEGMYMADVPAGPAVTEKLRNADCGH